MADTKGDEGRDAVWSRRDEGNDGALILACERLLFEHPRMTGESQAVTDDIVTVCHALLGIIFPESDDQPMHDVTAGKLICADVIKSVHVKDEEVGDGE